MVLLRRPPPPDLTLPLPGIEEEGNARHGWPPGEGGGREVRKGVVKPMVRRFNRDERANLAHALTHLEANKIADTSAYGGWYCGNKEQSVNRHVKAVAFVQSLLTPNA